MCRFSVVVPTKNRPETLYYCLKTCLDQDFSDFEIIVFDNAGRADTRAVVEGLSAASIKYHRSDILLPMQDSWENALSCAKGEIIIFIGDDDGLMPFALSALDKFFRSSGLAAVTWQCGIYTWPDMALSSLANRLLFSLAEDVDLYDSRRLIKESLSDADKAPLLPNIYHGAVRRDVLESVRLRAGRVFAGVHPDTFSSFSVAYVVKEHAYIKVPLSITGFSGSSGNVAFTFERNQSSTGVAIRSANAEHRLTYHPWVPDLPSPLCVAADSFLQVKSRLFPHDEALVLDRKRFLDALLNELPVAGADQVEPALAVIAHTLADDPKLLKWFHARLKKIAPRIKPVPSFVPETFHPRWGYLFLDTKQIGLADIQAATKVASAALGYGLRTIDLAVPRHTKAKTLVRAFLTRQTTATA